MNNATKVERLTPLDLLMPRTYIGVLFVFRDTEDTLSVLGKLQNGLNQLSTQLPWLSGHVFPTNASRTTEKNEETPGLEIRWDTNAVTPTIIDKGSMEKNYEDLAAAGMPPSAILSDVWPVPTMIDDASFTAGVPVFGASIFQFSERKESKEMGLCICLHHNVVDAAGFAEVVRLWARNIAGFETPHLNSGLGRLKHLSGVFSADLHRISVNSLDDILTSHPEHSKVPPTLPTEFPPCSSKLFKVPLALVENIKEQLRSCMPSAPTTNTLVCALIWSSVTRARTQRHPAIGDQTSQLAMAVNGRRRINSEFSKLENPYFGNLVVYSLAQHSIQELGTSSEILSLAGICNEIARSQSSAQIDARHIAEVYSLVDSVKDYRTIFPGWDLFNSRDFTITSWADLDLYALDFGPAIGKPEFIRMPYSQADGVGIVMPRKRIAEEMLEIVIMLRNDDLASLELSSSWESFTK